MAGYDGYSMSNNARDAYDNDEKPVTKWTKSEILELLEIRYNVPTEDIEKLRRYTNATLKSYFLAYSSWHHTGKFYNETSFYAIEESRTNQIDFSLLDMMEQAGKEDRETRKLKSNEYTKAHITYEENISNYRNYPYFKRFENYCLIKGNWAYLADGTKKKIDGNHILNVEKFDKAPRGTKQTFDAIKKKWKI